MNGEGRMHTIRADPKLILRCLYSFEGSGGCEAHTAYDQALCRYENTERRQKYVGEILKKFGMITCKPIATLIEKNAK